HRQLSRCGFRRCWQSLGNPRGSTFTGHSKQAARALCRCRPRQNPAVGSHYSVHSEAAARTLRAQRTGSGSMIMRALLAGDAYGKWFVGLLVAAAALTPVLSLLVPPTSPLHIPASTLSLYGKYLCFALLALSLDLVWGYCGILSLGHGAFF